MTGHSSPDGRPCRVSPDCAWQPEKEGWVGYRIPQQAFGFRTTGGETGCLYSDDRDTLLTCTAGQGVGERRDLEERNGDEPAAGSAISAEGVGMHVAFLDSRRVEYRRYQALHRLVELQSSEAFGELPEDLRQRIVEMIAESSERG
jgi:hypothetical protein